MNWSIQRWVKQFGCECGLYMYTGVEVAYISVLNINTTVVRLEVLKWLPAKATP